MMREDGAEPRLIPLLGFKPLIGVIHLPPVPGKIRPGDEPEHLIEYAVTEATKLENAGFDAAVIENYGDKPYHMDPSDDIFLVATMTSIAREVTRATNLIIGINILRNAAIAALAVAYASSASFIRVNSYCETRLTPEGIMEPVGASIEDLRRKLPRNILVLADVDVKHSYPLVPVKDAVRECGIRGTMDAIIVSGARTSEAPPPGYVASIRALIPSKPLLIGSGITVENIEAYWNIADGFIVGTSIKYAGTMSPINPEKAEKLARKVKEMRARSIHNIPLGGRYAMKP